MNEKKTILITGASSGIGYELAKTAAKEGFNLVVAARSKDKLENLAGELQSLHQTETKVIAMDLAEPGSGTRLYDQLKTENVIIDILVNNAGFADFGFFIERDWEKERRMINLNITTLTELTKLFARDMVKRGEGKILNVASTAAFQPGPLMAVYYATKSYVLHFSEALSNELKGTGVTIMTLCPGATISGFQETAEMKHSRLMKIMPFVSSEKVARYAFRVLMKNKTVAIPGLFNKMGVFSIRLIPRKMATNMIRKMSDVSG